jgi:hypothetical protein
MTKIVVRHDHATIDQQSPKTKTKLLVFLIDLAHVRRGHYFIFCPALEPPPHITILTKGRQLVNRNTRRFQRVLTIQDGITVGIVVDDGDLGDVKSQFGQHLDAREGATTRRQNVVDDHDRSGISEREHRDIVDL